MTQAKVIMSGNEAMARGAWEAGVTVAASYPGTPATQILEQLVRFEEIHAQWSPNEKVALDVVFGASLGGARAMASMKHVGVNVASDSLMTIAYAGVNGGLVLVSADDPHMYSSQNEQDNRNFAPFAKIPMIEPASPEEAKDLTHRAFEISEEFDVPVLLRATTRLCHGRGVVEPGPRADVPLKPYEKDYEKYMMLPTVARKRRRDLLRRMERLEEFAESFPGNRVIEGSTDLGIISSGTASLYAREAVPGASFLVLSLTWPLPRRLIRSFADRVKKLVVVEELDPFLETHIRAMGIEVTGKDLLPSVGELRPEIVAAALRPDAKPAARSLSIDPPPRPPALCPGCSYRPVFYLLRQLKAKVMGDIGCYALGAYPPLGAMDMNLCMGASIGVAHGMEKALRKGGKERGRIVGVIGDSTFVHAGIAPLMDLVYNKGTCTVLLLDNATTAMTGRQDHPGSGKTAAGEETVTVDYVKLAEAVGLKRVIEADPYNLGKLRAVLKQELDSDEPSLVILRAPCALTAMRRPTHFSLVDPEKCKNCDTCFKLGCHPIEKDDEGRARVNPSWCVGCSVCIQVCVRKAMTLKKREGGRRS